MQEKRFLSLNQKSMNYNSQIRQMRILAEAALTHYNLGNARLTLLTHKRNTVFRVTTSLKVNIHSPNTTNCKDEQKIDKEKSFALRLSSPNDYSRAMLQSELLWLIDLCNEAELIVPQPVLTRKGALIVDIAVEGLAEIKYGVLFHWVKGRFVNSTFSPALVERVGRFMAQLHQHSRRFTPPPHFIRPSWDSNSFFDEKPIFSPSLSPLNLPPFIGNNEYQLILAAINRIQEELPAISKNEDSYGLIHGNLQPNSYLFHQGNVHAIDFKHCCWGYFLFDIAVTFHGFTNHDNENEMQEAFCRGYQSICPLPLQYKEKRDVFIALFWIKRINEWLNTSQTLAANVVPTWWYTAMNWLQQFVISYHSVP